MSFGNDMDEDRPDSGGPPPVPQYAADRWPEGKEPTNLELLQSIGDSLRDIRTEMMAAEEALREMEERSAEP